MQSLLLSSFLLAQRAIRAWACPRQLSKFIVRIALVRTLATLRLSALTGLAVAASLVHAVAASGPSVLFTSLLPQGDGQTEWPGKVVADSNGTIYVEYATFNRAVEILKISPNGKMSLFPNRIVGRLAAFTFDALDNFYVLDGIGLRKFKPDGSGMKLSPTGFVNEQFDTVPFLALPSANAIAVDASGENVYVLSTQQTILRITATGSVTTFAGASGERGRADGTSLARFNNPSGIAVDTMGNIFVTDSDNYVIRKVTKDGVVSTFAGLRAARDTKTA